MPAINFPNSPSVGDTYTVNGRTYTWTGTTWVVTSGNVVPSFSQANSAFDRANTANNTAVANTLANGYSTVRSTRNKLNFVPASGNVRIAIEDDAAGDRVNVVIESLGGGGGSGTGANLTAANVLSNGKIIVRTLAYANINFIPDTLFDFDVTDDTTHNAINVAARSSSAPFTMANNANVMANAAYIAANAAFARANTGLQNVVEDTDPELGGFIDFNNFGADGNGTINLTAYRGHHLSSGEAVAYFDAANAETFPGSWGNSMKLVANRWPALFFYGKSTNSGLIYAWDSGALSNTFWMEHVTGTGSVDSGKTLYWGFHDEHYRPATDGRWSIGRPTTRWSNVFTFNVVTRYANVYSNVSILQNRTEVDNVALDITADWANTAQTFTLIRANVANTTNVSSNSAFLDLQANGVAQFRVMANGDAYTRGSLGIMGDTFIHRDSAGRLALRNGTTPQGWRIYNTFTDLSNFERAGLYFFNNQAFFTTVAGGTGQARDMNVGTEGAANVTYMTGGTARWQVNSAGHMLTVADGSYDIGREDFYRPRNVFITGNVVANIVNANWGAIISGLNVVPAIVAAFGVANTANDRGNLAQMASNAAYDFANTINIKVDSAFALANQKFDKTGGPVSGNVAIRQERILAQNSALDLTADWANTGVQFWLIKANIANIANAAANSFFLDFQANTSSVFNVSTAGHVSTLGNVAANIVTAQWGVIAGGMNVVPAVQAAFFKANNAGVLAIANTLQINSYVATRSTGRTTLNFVPGTDIVVEISDDAPGDRTNIKIISTATAGVSAGEVFDATNSAFLVANTANQHANLAWRAANAAFDKANAANVLADSKYDKAGGVVTGNVAIRQPRVLADNIALDLTADWANTGQTFTLIRGNVANVANANSNSAFMDMQANGVYQMRLLANGMMLLAQSLFIGALNVEPALVAAYGVANVANDRGNLAQMAANAAFAQSNIAMLTVSSAYDRTNVVSGVANTANDRGNLAQMAANGAFAQSNIAMLTVSSAYDRVNVVSGVANVANDRGNLAQMAANAAFAQSNIAMLTVSSAYDRINVVSAVANTANQRGNLAQMASNAAFDKANAANITANSTSIANTYSNGYVHIQSTQRTINFVADTTDLKIRVQDNTTHGLANVRFDAPGIGLAYAQANFAMLTTSTAYDRVNVVSAVANTANDRANLAQMASNAAYDFANTINAKADHALFVANTANLRGNLAQMASNGAYDKANAANLLANQLSAVAQTYSNGYVIQMSTRGTLNFMADTTDIKIQVQDNATHGLVNVRFDAPGIGAAYTQANAAKTEADAVFGVANVHNGAILAANTIAIAAFDVANAHNGAMAQMNSAIFAVANTANLRGNLAQMASNAAYDFANSINIKVDNVVTPLANQVSNVANTYSNGYVVLQSSRGTLNFMADTLDIKIRIQDNATHGLTNVRFDAPGIGQAFNQANAAKTEADAVFGVANVHNGAILAANTIAIAAFDVANVHNGAMAQMNTAIFGVANTANQRANLAQMASNAAYDFANTINIKVDSVVTPLANQVSNVANTYSNGYVVAQSSRGTLNFMADTTDLKIRIQDNATHGLTNVRFDAPGIGLAYAQANFAMLTVSSAYDRVNVVSGVANTANDRGNLAQMASNAAYDFANTINSIARSAFDRVNANTVVVGNTLSNGFFIQRAARGILNFVPASSNLRIEVTEDAAGDRINVNIETFGSGGGGGITEVVQDTSPELGGDLDLNTFDIIDPDHSANITANVVNADWGLIVGRLNVGPALAFAQAQSNVAMATGSHAADKANAANILANQVSAVAQTYSNGYVIQMSTRGTLNFMADTTDLKILVHDNATHGLVNVRFDAPGIGQAFNKANAANSIAEAAIIHANSAHIVANTANVRGNLAQMASNAAYDFANTINAKADHALFVANTANVRGNLAQMASNGAYDKANAANILANQLSAVAQTFSNGYVLQMSTRGTLNFMADTTDIKILVHDNATHGLVNVRFDAPGIGAAYTQANAAKTEADAVFGVANVHNGAILAANTIAIAAFDVANVHNGAMAQMNTAIFGVANTANQRANLAQMASNAAYDFANTINIKVDGTVTTLANQVSNVANTYSNGYVVLQSSRGTLNFMADTLDIKIRIQDNASHGLTNVRFDAPGIGAAYGVANAAKTEADAVFGVANVHNGAILAANTIAIAAFDVANVHNGAMAQMNTAIFGVANTANQRANLAQMASNAAYDFANTINIKVDNVVTPLANQVSNVANTYSNGYVVLQSSRGTLNFMADTLDIKIRIQDNASHGLTNVRFDAPGIGLAYAQANFAMLTVSSAYDRVNVVSGVANTGNLYANLAFRAANAVYDFANVININVAATMVVANTANVRANLAQMASNAAYDFANTINVKLESGFTTLGSIAVRDRIHGNLTGNVVNIISLGVGSNTGYLRVNTGNVHFFTTPAIEVWQLWSNAAPLGGAYNAAVINVKTAVDGGNFLRILDDGLTVFNVSQDATTGRYTVDSVGNVTANIVVANWGVISGGKNTLPYMVAAFDLANTHNGAMTAMNAISIAAFGVANVHNAAMAQMNTAIFGAANSANFAYVGNTMANTYYATRAIRHMVNFVPGTNITVNVDDDSAGDRVNVTIAATGTGITEVAEDTSPTLGGDLDANGNDITNISYLEVDSTDGMVQIGEGTFASKAATTEYGIQLGEAAHKRSGLTTEVDGDILSLGINIYQIGGRDTNQAGGIFRFDTRTSNREFTVIAQQPGDSGTSETQIYRQSLVSPFGATFAGNVRVLDESYSSGWDSKTEVPTKNAIYDKIVLLEAIDTAVFGTANSHNGAMSQMNTAIFGVANTANQRANLAQMASNAAYDFANTINIKVDGTITTLANQVSNVANTYSNGYVVLQSSRGTLNFMADTLDIKIRIQDNATHGLTNVRFDAPGIGLAYGVANAAKTEADAVFGVANVHNGAILAANTIAIAAFDVANVHNGAMAQMNTAIFGVANTANLYANLAFRAANAAYDFANTINIKVDTIGNAISNVANTYSNGYVVLQSSRGTLNFMADTLDIKIRIQDNASHGLTNVRFDAPGIGLAYGVANAAKTEADAVFGVANVHNGAILAANTIAIGAFDVANVHNGAILAANTIAIAAFGVANVHNAAMAQMNTAIFGAANAANILYVGNTMANGYYNTRSWLAQRMNFVPGANVTVNIIDDTAGNRVNVVIESYSSGGASGPPVQVSEAEPGTTTANSLWWKSDTGQLFVRYNDGSSTQWVEVGAFGDGEQQEEVLTFAVTSEESATTGLGVFTYHFAKPFTLTGVMGSCSANGSSGNTHIDMNKNGTTIFTNNITIRAANSTSDTHATQPSLTASPTTFVRGDKLNVDVDLVSTGTLGLKVHLIGYWTPT